MTEQKRVCIFYNTSFTPTKNEIQSVFEHFFDIIKVSDYEIDCIECLDTVQVQTAVTRCNEFYYDLIFMDIAPRSQIVVAMGKIFGRLRKSLYPRIVVQYFHMAMEFLVACHHITSEQAEALAQLPNLFETVGNQTNTRIFAIILGVQLPKCLQSL